MMLFRTQFAFGVAIVVLQSGCSPQNQEAEEGNRTHPVFDLQVVANEPCIFRVSSREFGSKLRNNAGVRPDHVSLHIYGPMSYADAKNAQGSVYSLKCAESVQMVRSRTGDLCPEC